MLLIRSQTSPEALARSSETVQQLEIEVESHQQDQNSQLQAKREEHIAELAAVTVSHSLLLLLNLQSSRTGCRHGTLRNY